MSHERIRETSDLGDVAMTMRLTEEDVSTAEEADGEERPSWNGIEEGGGGKIRKEKGGGPDAHAEGC